ncbi:ankyrin repeat domain-containing protein [Endozoicomonas sp. SESOKO2]|uniref:ankyrin repeat domain-containing protein n=1 Tax=Endozoicomonas sp. SESOKO2 TaxID=2828743 RepID=UPI00214817F2|nr:ankyrin repeat domain-containing protein [Endozoicomonas sp. SESOKO2]
MKTGPRLPTDQVQSDQMPRQQDLDSARFKHRAVQSTDGQTFLHMLFAAFTQSTSLLSRVTQTILRPLLHLIGHGELLLTRAQKIEQSKSEPQKRLPFLVMNLMSLSTRFDGEDKARLYDFSDGCCYGLASSYVLYEQLGCSEEYDELLSTVSQDPALGWVFWDNHYDHLADAILDAQQMFKADPATQDHQTLFLLKLRPFCESLLAFQAPGRTTLQEEVPEQNTEKTAQWIVSAADGNTPVLHSTPSYPIGLTESGLCLLLNKIAETTREGGGSRLFHLRTGMHILSLQVTSEGFEIRDQNIRNYKQLFKKERDFFAAKCIAESLNTSQILSSGMAIPNESTDTVFSIKEFTNVSSASNNSGHRRLETLLAEIPEARLLPINHRNPHKFNQLLLAVAFGPSEVAEKVMVKATEVADIEPGFFNQQDHFGQVALTLAIAMNHTNVVHKLLDQPGIRTNLPRQDGAIPLHSACHYGHAEIVEKLLVRPDVQINHKTNEGETPILMAIKAGHIEIVKRLLEQGADIEASSVALAPEACHGEIRKLIETELKKRGL